MQKQFYFLSPIEAVKVTAENLQEVADWCGGKVVSIESKKTPGTMDQYVWVPVPNKGSYLSDAYPGMWVTRRLVIGHKEELRVSWAVMRQDHFRRNYFETPLDSTVKTWEREVAERRAKEIMRGKIFGGSSPLSQPMMIAQAAIDKVNEGVIQVENIFTQSEPVEVVAEDDTKVEQAATSIFETVQQDLAAEATS